MKKFLTIIFLFFSANIFAQVPQGISYQAVAFNTGGNPVVNGTVGVRISILDNSTSGPTIYSETHSKSTNAQGLFNLIIGEGNVTSGSFTSIGWSAGSKFLKVEIDPAGGSNYTITGASQLMSVPYALQAKSADNVNAANIIGSIEPDNTATGVMTSSYGYAYNNNQWYAQSLSGTPVNIIATVNNVGIMTSSYAYAFETNQWYAQSLSGTSQKIIGSSGAIGVITSSYAYAYSNGTWHAQSVSGTTTEIVANQGVIGVMSTSYGYAFNNGSWYAQSLSGTPMKVIAKGNKILIYTSSYAYTFDGSGNSWYAQSLSGTPLDYAR